MRNRESVFAYRTAGGLTRLFALGALALTVAAFFFGRAAWADPKTGPSDSNGWVYLSDAGHSSNEAEGPNIELWDGGCEGVAGILFGTDPAWVRVGLSPQPTTPFVEARGQILNENPRSIDSPNPRITYLDTPQNHYSMDLIFFMTLDPAYRQLLSGGEFNGLMQVEWERGGVPMYAYPSTGDRVTVWGPHIWDCGHGDSWDGDDNVYKTEIHPPVGWVVYRNSADADGAPGSDAKRDRNWIWYDPTSDLQGSGASLPDHGTLNTPVNATVADAFFSSFGGEAVAALNGCRTDPEDEILFDTCKQNNEWRQNVLQQSYTFFVPAPPKPAGDPIMIWEKEDRCGDVPPSPANPPDDDPEDVFDAGILSTAYHIGAPTCGIAASESVGVDENNRPGLWVTVNSTPTSYPPNNYIVFAQRYKVAWDYVAPAAQAARRVQVTFHTIRVYDDGELLCAEDGEWLLSLRANEGWIYPVRGHGDSDAPFWEFDAVDDGKDCLSGDEPYDEYSINESVIVSAAHDQPIIISSGGFESDILFTNYNERIPALYELRDPGGPYTSSLAQGADGPIYRIIYTVTDITPPPPTAGTLTIGDPKYGPNDDTGGTATRVSKTTPIKLEGSDASALEYRYWKDGDPVPATWLFDTNGGDLLVDLTGATSDGRYTIEYAPVSQYSIVGQRRTVSIELDSTAPVLTVPDDMVVDATSAAGRIVDYVVTALDALPGRVELVCTPASGSFFAIKQVTTVNCTATDAVDNESTDSFTVEVVSPFGYIPDFVLLSHQWTSVGGNVIVRTGNVGAFDASAGVPGSAGFEVVLGPGAIATGGPKVAAQSVRLQSSTRVGNVYAVDPIAVGSGVTYTAKNGYVPLFLGMPVVPAFNAGGQNKTFSGPANALAAGSYGKLKLSPNAVVTLTGGNYYFTSIEMGSNAQLLFSAAANIHVTGRVSVGNSARVLPAAGSGIVAHNIVFWVTGTDGPPTSPTAFNTSNDVQLQANVYARNGTVTLGQYNNATGAFLGLRVNVQNNTTLYLDSAFDFPYP
jgi:hypothetical protein